MDVPNSSKPIRIFIMRDLTTALFMAAYYQKEKMRSESFRDVCIILWYRVPAGCRDERESVRDKFPVGACQKIAKAIFPEIIMCEERHLKYISMSFANMFNDRLEKIDYLNLIRKIFAENNISTSAIKEVYHGNKTFHQYVKYLAPQVKLIGFEHGTSDIRTSLVKHRMVNRLNNRVKHSVGKLFYVFYEYEQNDDIIVSLLASQIRQINKKDNITSIDGRYIKNVANAVIFDDFTDKTFLNKNNYIAIVLISDGYEIFDNNEGRLKFHRDFAKYILSEIRTLIPQVNTVIFKTFPFDEFPRELKDEFVAYFSGYKVYFFDDITKENYPVEYYIDTMRPKVIFGDISSGLFYSKAVMPEIETYTYHEYTMAYQLKHFGRSFFDYKWLDNIFFRKYGGVFNGVAPIKLNYGG